MDTAIGDFNPRSPCGERREHHMKTELLIQFQPTLPVRGATSTSRWGATPWSYFNPRSPCGERPLHHRQRMDHSDFNPRSPCGERQVTVGTVLKLKEFQPTLPVRGATGLPLRDKLLVRISTHAPRAGSDRGVRGWRLIIGDFNPRSPCGERRGGGGGLLHPGAISTHAPRAGSDMELYRNINGHVRFQPTLPVRGATWGLLQLYQVVDEFQPTLPVRGATGDGRGRRGGGEISTHAPRAGSDATALSTLQAENEFQPTLPVRGATIPPAGRGRW